jgi:putative inorganic carbon (hco3(-)) transporter
MLLAVVAVLSVGAILLALSGHIVGAGVAVLIVMYSRLAETSAARGDVLAVAEIGVVGLALIIFGIRTFEGGARSMTGTVGFWSAAVLYLAVLYASSIWAVDAGAAIAQADTLAKDLIVVYIVAEAFSTVRGQRLASWTIIAVAAFLAGISIIQAISHTYSNSYFGLAQASVHQIVGQTHGYRSAGPIGDPNFYGLALAVVIPLALFRVRDETSRRLRIVAAAAIVLLLSGIVLTYSRTAVVAVAVTLVGFLAMSNISLRHISLAALCALPFLVFVPSEYWHRAASITSDDQSIQGRTASDRVAFEIFLTHPVFGVGADNYQDVYTSYQIRLHVLDAAPDAHDLYLATASETGLLGLATLGGALVIVLRRTWRARRDAIRAGDRLWEGLAGGSFLALIGYLTGSLFVPNAFPRYLWILVGLAIASSQRPVVEVDIPSPLLEHV